LESLGQSIKVNIVSVIRGVSTYTNRNGRAYSLKVLDKSGPNVEVYYEITTGTAKRIVSRVFPKEIEINDRFL
jgi:hypothetical protein